MSTANADSSIGVARSVANLRSRVGVWRENRETIALVPTMGALHQGHLSLVAKARAIADRTVASIFVNPKQFAAHEDLDTYPRDEARDLELLQNAGCDLAFIPSPEQMYPDGFQTSVSVAEVSQGLCGASRPQFFGGIATVVCKLLNQCRPDYAIFGEKDFQQLLVIKRMARDLDLNVEILGAPIVRESDGLAMSSRNAYLSTEERSIAGHLNKTLAAMAESIEKGDALENVIDTGRKNLINAGLTEIDYLDIRNARDLSATDLTGELRIFAAVMLGKTRLIDNWPAFRP